MTDTTEQPNYVLLCGWQCGPVFGLAQGALDGGWNKPGQGFRRFSFCNEAFLPCLARRNNSPEEV